MGQGAKTPGEAAEAAYAAARLCSESQKWDAAARAGVERFLEIARAQAASCGPRSCLTIPAASPASPAPGLPGGICLPPPANRISTHY